MDNLGPFINYYSKYATVVLLEELCSLYYRSISTSDSELSLRCHAIRLIILQRTGDRKASGFPA